MPVEKMPEFDPPPVNVDCLRTDQERREWVQELSGRMVDAELRQELEERRAERMRHEGPLVRLAFRVLGPLLADPLDVMFGPKSARAHRD